MKIGLYLSECRAHLHVFVYGCCLVFRTSPPSWPCCGIQDTSPGARVGWRIYWSALVPQTHIPLIDLLKHYHNQLTLAVQLSLAPPTPPCFDQ